MQCAAVTKSGRCPNEAIDKEVCQDHLGWTQGNAGALGFNMIVKNEEKHLARCLQSIRQIADEIVVVDTGSADSTIDIALKYADKVLYHEWRHDFSEARNFGFQFSTTDWIGWIDADERLLAESVEVVVDTIQRSGGANAIFCAMLSELADGRTSKHYLPKFFRRGTAHFEQPVHNQLVHQSPVIQSEIGFWHVGYNLDDETMKRKRQRTTDLLLKQLDENPDDAFATMNLARTYMTDKQYQKSLQIAEDGLKLKDATGALRQMLLYNQAMCAVYTKEYKKVFAACWECLSINSTNLDILFVLGWVCILQGQWAKSIVFLNRYLQCRGEQDTDGFNLLIQDFWQAYAQTYNFLGLAYQNTDDRGRSIDAHRKAVDYGKYDVQNWKNLAAMCEVSGDRYAVEQALYGAVDIGVADNDVWSQIQLLANRTG